MMVRSGIHRLMSFTKSTTPEPTIIRSRYSSTRSATWLSRRWMLAGRNHCAVTPRYFMCSGLSMVGSERLRGAPPVSAAIRASSSIGSSRLRFPARKISLLRSISMMSSYLVIAQNGR